MKYLLRSPSMVIEFEASFFKNDKQFDETLKLFFDCFVKDVKEDIEFLEGKK